MKKLPLIALLIVGCDIMQEEDWDGKITKYYENGNFEQEIIWVKGYPEDITDYDEDGNKI